MTKVFGPIFLVLSRVTNLKEIYTKFHSHSYHCCRICRSTILGPTRLLKTQIFEKKSKTSGEKIYLTDFCRVIEHEKAHKTLYKDP